MGDWRSPKTRASNLGLTIGGTVQPASKNKPNEKDIARVRK